MYTTREIVNYPSVEESTGPDLMAKMAKHAEDFGVEIRQQTVKSVSFTPEDKILKTRKVTYHAKAVILATGTAARVLDIPGEKEFTGRGVGYCATCDAEFYQDQEVVVLGSGDQAIEESIFIAKFASKVTIVVVHDEGVLDCNKLAAEQAMKHPKLHFIWNSTLAEVCGDDEVTGVKVKDVRTGDITDVPCQGVFFFCGMVPVTEFLAMRCRSIRAAGYIPMTIWIWVWAACSLQATCARNTCVRLPLRWATVRLRQLRQSVISPRSSSSTTMCWEAKSRCCWDSGIPRLTAAWMRSMRCVLKTVRRSTRSVSSNSM